MNPAVEEMPGGLEHQTFLWGPGEIFLHLFIFCISRVFPGSSAVSQSILLTCLAYPQFPLAINLL